MPGIREYYPAANFGGLGVGAKCGASPQCISRLDREATMKLIKKAALATLALSVAFVSGCGERHSTKEVYYLVSANLALPYWQTAAAGFNKAAAQYKVTAKVVGPENYDPQAELAELQKAVAAKPAGILISVADISVIQPGIDAAINAGIPALTAASISGCSSATSTTEIRIPDGLAAIALCNAASSACGSWPSGPSTLAVTLYSAAALLNPAAAVCQ